MAPRRRTPGVQRDVYGPVEADVIERAGCTWCGAGVSEPCRSTSLRRNAAPPAKAHAQRWVDLWNEEHPEDRIRVYVQA